MSVPSLFGCSAWSWWRLDLREKFKDIMKQNSPEQRQTYIYPTTATVCSPFCGWFDLKLTLEKDTATTGLTLDGVRDGILRENLAASWLIWWPPQTFPTLRAATMAVILLFFVFFWNCILLLILLRHCWIGGDCSCHFFLMRRIQLYLWRFPVS